MSTHCATVLYRKSTWPGFQQEIPASLVSEQDKETIQQHYPSLAIKPYGVHGNCIRMLNDQGNFTLLPQADANAMPYLQYWLERIVHNTGDALALVRYSEYVQSTRFDSEVTAWVIRHQSVECLTIKDLLDTWMLAWNCCRRKPTYEDLDQFCRDAAEHFREEIDQDLPIDGSDATDTLCNLIRRAQAILGPEEKER